MVFCRFEKLCGIQRAGPPQRILDVYAVQIRRLHDTNRSGWFSLIGIIPYVGLIIVLVLCAMKGTEGDNDYGEDPLESEYENNGD